MVVPGGAVFAVFAVFAGGCRGVPGGAGWCRVVPGGAGWCREMLSMGRPSKVMGIAHGFHMCTGHLRIIAAHAKCNARLGQLVNPLTHAIRVVENPNVGIHS